MQRVALTSILASDVVAIDRLRMRPAGNVLFVDLDVAVSRTIPLATHGFQRAGLV